MFLPMVGLTILFICLLSYSVSIALDRGKALKSRLSIGLGMAAIAFVGLYLVLSSLSPSASAA